MDSRTGDELVETLQHTNRIIAARAAAAKRK